MLRHPVERLVSQFFYCPLDHDIQHRPSKVTLSDSLGTQGGDVDSSVKGSGQKCTAIRHNPVQQAQLCKKRAKMYLAIRLLSIGGFVCCFCEACVDFLLTA